MLGSEYFPGVIKPEIGLNELLEHYCPKSNTTRTLELAMVIKRQVPFDR